ncbi:unnamed protein product [Rhizoctonia solani]|uniref:Uncharacterized protein n=1 Tax=Rhizoctonia solani TaxID=456999 RepID=A0A8H3BPU2_9AGAM|nr:unnamed protein product [Rhizoctonia solani]
METSPVLLASSYAILGARNCGLQTPDYRNQTPNHEALARYGKVYRDLTGWSACRPVSSSFWAYNPL